MKQINRQLKPSLSVNLPRATINIGADTIRALKHPSHIALLQSIENKSIAVVPCEPGNLMAFKVPEQFMVRENIKFVITSKRFVASVISFADLDPNKTHIFYGTVESEKNRVIFSLLPISAADNHEISST